MKSFERNLKSKFNFTFQLIISMDNFQRVLLLNYSSLHFNLHWCSIAQGGS